MRNHGAGRQARSRLPGAGPALSDGIIGDITRSLPGAVISGSGHDGDGHGPGYRTGDPGRGIVPGPLPIPAVRVADLGEKEAVLAAQPGASFTIPHFDGYPAVLIQLKNVSRAAMREAITDRWLACAPARLADQYLRR